MLIKVMSFNIAHGRGTDDVVDLERIAKVIEASDADIVGLQEVDRNRQRSGYADQAMRLSERLSMEFAYGPNMEEKPDGAETAVRQYGNAVLSRYPIKSAANHPLTCVPVQGDPNEPRGVQEVKVDAEGIEFTFFNTHLAKKEEELPVSIEEIMELLKSCTQPFVLTGDFNAPPWDEEIRKMGRFAKSVFLEKGEPLTVAHPPSFHADKVEEEPEPAARIDYIFISDGFSVKDSGVIETVVSDHRPIVADLELRN